jgi:hypothetical protein
MEQNGTLEKDTILAIALASGASIPSTPDPVFAATAAEGVP